jgi:hypothetical protein
MTLINTLKTQVDLPVWEWLRFAPASSSSLSSACSSDNSLYHPNHGRYIYYLLANNSFWRYDTYTDTYLQLANPVVTPTTFTSMKFAGATGFYSRVINSTTNTITSSTLYDKILNGFDIKIISGTGAGQQRTIVDVSDVVSADSGIATAVSSTTSLIRITDSTKSWSINQWVGYQVRITFGSGINQIRKVLYNDATSITLGDINQVAQNVDFMAPLPVAISSAAGSQSVYSIESGTITVDSNWLVQPDQTSRFVVQSGGIYLYTNAAPNLTYYDIAADIWYYCSVQTNVISNVTPTDIALGRTTENSSIWSKGVATSGTITSLTDESKNWTTNQYTDYWVRIFSGVGEGQVRQISSNTNNTLTWSPSGVAPDSTSRYMIEGFDAGIASSGTGISISDSSKDWPVDRWANYYLVITGGTGMGQEKSILSNTSDSITVATPFNTPPDNTSTFRIQGDTELLYIAMGAHSSIYTYCLEQEMVTGNKKIDGGVARSGSVRYGSQKPIAITSITRSGTTATVTTTQNHNFKTGDSVTHFGATGVDEALYNVTASITVTSLTTYTYTMSGTPAANAVFTAQSSTVLVDSTKNWTTNEWTGYLCYMTNTLSANPVGQSFRIASNTAKSLTFASAVTTTPINATTKYIIAKPNAFGALDSGIATGTHSTTTLQDTSKNWTVNIWAGRRIKFTGGAGVSIETTISSNTSNTLTFTSAVGTAPTNTTTYSILATTVKGLGVNFMWNYGVSNANKKGNNLIISRGGVLIGFERYNINTDTWDIVSTTPQTETLTGGSQFAYDGMDRFYFSKDLTQRCYYLDLNSYTIHGAGLFPYTPATTNTSVAIGNRMEIFETPDHLKYLWINRQVAQECFRSLLFY